MFKRFQIMDLFHDTEEFRTSEPKEWVDVIKELPDKPRGLFKVKLEDGSIIPAYYFLDECMNLMIGYERIRQNRLDAVVTTSKWYNQKTKDPISITHWGSE